MNALASLRISVGSLKLPLLARATRQLHVRLARGGSRISGKGVHMYKGVGVRFADFI